MSTETRIEALERSNRRAKMGLFLGGTCTGVLALLACRPQDPAPLQDLRVRSISVVDAKGVVVATLGPNGADGAGELALFCPDPGLTDRAYPPMGSRLAADALGRLILQHSHGKEPAPKQANYLAFSADSLGATISLVGFGKDEGVFLESRRERLVISAVADDSTVKVYDKEGKIRVGLGVGGQEINRDKGWFGLFNQPGRETRETSWYIKQ